MDDTDRMFCVLLRTILRCRLARAVTGIQSAKRQSVDSGRAEHIVRTDMCIQKNHK